MAKKQMKDYSETIHICQSIQLATSRSGDDRTPG